MCIRMYICRHIHIFVHIYKSLDSYIQPIADRVALNLEIILKKNSTNQNSAHWIYD